MSRATKTLRARIRGASQMGARADFSELASAIDDVFTPGDTDPEMRGNFHVAAFAAARMNEARLALGHAAAMFERSMEDCYTDDENAARDLDHRSVPLGARQVAEALRAYDRSE